MMLLLLMLLLLPAHASATRYWVAPSGSDANACSAVDGDEDPGVYKATPAGGKACLAGGDTLTIKAGTYTGSTAVFTSIPAGTAPSTPTIIEGDPGDQAGCALTSTCSVILQPSGASTVITVSNVIWRKFRVDHINAKNRYPLEIVGTGISNILVEDVELYNTQGSSSVSADFLGGLITTSQTSFITFNRIHVHATGNIQTQNGHGLYIQGDDTTVQNSLIYDNGNTGIQCFNGHTTSDGRPDRCVITNTILRNNPNAGVIIEGHDAKIFNCLIYDNSGAGVIAGFGGANRLKVYKNVIKGNGGAGVSLRAGNTDSEIIDNVITGNGGAETENTGGSTGIITTYNACTASESCGSTGKLTITALGDILVSTSDLRLKAGSAAIDAGTAVTGVTCNGICDIGAFEAIPTPSASITANQITLVYPMSTNVPIAVPAAAGASVSCTGHASCPGSPTVNAATRITNTDSQVAVTISGIAGNACENTQTWTFGYNSATGTWSDSASIGGLNQPVFSVTNLAVTNNCTGGGPASYPAGYHIFYKFDEGTGTNANDESANNLDCTLTSGAGWGAGNKGNALSVTSGTQQYCAIPWGSGVNPSTQSITAFIPIFIVTGTETALHYVGGPDIGTNQRAYVCGHNGTWKISMQAVPCSSTAASNLAVTAGWNLLTLQFNSTTDVATLYKGTLAGTGGASVAYTSFTFATNWKLGRLHTNNATGSYLFDDFLVYLSIVAPADLVAAFNAPVSAPGGTLAQAAVQVQGVLYDTSGNPIIFPTPGNRMEVVDDGAVVLLFQIHCENVSNCDPTAFKLVYAKNGSSVWIQVPNTQTADGTWMWGADTSGSLNAGTRSTRLTGSCALTNGSTQLTADQIPSVDLPQDGCTVLAYIVRVDATPGTDYFEYKLQTESGADLSGGYDAIVRLDVVNPRGSAGF